MIVVALRGILRSQNLTKKTTLDCKYLFFWIATENRYNDFKELHVDTIYSDFRQVQTVFEKPNTT